MRGVRPGRGGTVKVAVVGGGLAGLAAGLFLARRGHEAVVIERDDVATPCAARRGTPQAGQSHAFVARCRQLLLAEAPDVLDALLLAGTNEIRLGSGLDPELVVLAARRSVFEAALRQVAEAEPGVRLRSGAAAVGLVTDTENRAIPVVRGVALDDGTSVLADVVVDAGGRRSPVGGWLESMGVRIAARSVPCGIAYCSQFFERRSDADRPSLNRGHVGGGSFDRYSCLVFLGDARTFSVTFGILPEDRELRALHHDAAFLAAARTIPVVRDWLDPDESRPITSVATMRGLENSVRPLVESGRPVVLGLLAIGDAACITNPAHTRGSTLALTSALAAAQVVTEHQDHESRALAMDDYLQRALVPWFWDSVEQDASRLESWRPDDATTLAPRPGPDRVTNAAAYIAAQSDTTVWRRFTRLQQMLHMPADVLEDPDIVARTWAVLGSGRRPPTLPAPTHAELFAVAAASSPQSSLNHTG